MLDVRNEYESGIGGFQNAVAPHTETFRGFPEYVQQNLDPAATCQGRDVLYRGVSVVRRHPLTCCPGVFREVLQLQGGILNYLEKIDSKDSLWEGECFVFDSRVAVNHDLGEGDYEQCFACRRPITENDMASEKYRPGVSCPSCHDDLTPAQRRRFSERQRQVELAQRRGEKHIGES